MIKFQIKTKDAQCVLNLKEQIELCDDVIVTSNQYNNNPLNDIDVKTIINKETHEWYHDPNGILYPKQFLDMYYKEIEE